MLQIFDTSTRTSSSSYLIMASARTSPMIQVRLHVCLEIVPPLYTIITSKIKDEITSITHPPDLHGLFFTKMRWLNYYSEQTALKTFIIILSGGSIADFSDFKKRKKGPSVIIIS